LALQQSIRLKDLGPGVYAIRKQEKKKIYRTGAEAVGGGGGRETAVRKHSVATQEEEERCNEVKEAQRDGGVLVRKHSHCQVFLVVFRSEQIVLNRIISCAL
jgi:hypothetical protein